MQYHAEKTRERRGYQGHLRSWAFQGNISVLDGLRLYWRYLELTLMLGEFRRKATGGR
jgi:hypothetical protein